MSAIHRSPACVHGPRKGALAINAVGSHLSMTSGSIWCEITNEAVGASDGLLDLVVAGCTESDVVGSGSGRAALRYVDFAAVQALNAIYPIAPIAIRLESSDKLACGAATPALSIECTRDIHGSTVRNFGRATFKGSTSQRQITQLVPTLT